MSKIETGKSSGPTENKFETFRGLNAICDLCGWTTKGLLEVEVDSGDILIRSGLIKKIMEHHLKKKLSVRRKGHHRKFTLTYKGEPSGGVIASSDAAYAFLYENLKPSQPVQKSKKNT